MPIWKCITGTSHVPAITEVSAGVGVDVATNKVGRVAVEVGVEVNVWVGVSVGVEVMVGVYVEVGVKVGVGVAIVIVAPSSGKIPFTCMAVPVESPAPVT